ncbi:MAG: tRNA (adenosine(37)-N6)-dimethylallyltransferase, partial [Mycobacterium sp.]
IADPAEDFSVTRFQESARTALAGIAARRHRAVLVGGTGLYLRAVVDDLDIPGRWPKVVARLEAEVPSANGDHTLVPLHDRLRLLDPVGASRIEPSNRRRLIRALEVTLGSGRPFSSFGPGLEKYPSTSCRMVGLEVPGEELDRRIESRFSTQMQAGWLEEVRSLESRPGGMSPTARQALGYRELLSHLEDGVPLDQAVSEGIRRTKRFARRQMSWFRRDPRVIWVDARDNPFSAVRGLLGDWGSWRS